MHSNKEWSLRRGKVTQGIRANVARVEIKINVDSRLKHVGMKPKRKQDISYHLLIVDKKH